MSEKKDKLAGSLSARAKRIRRHILRMTLKASGGHIAPALSIADIMTVLYFYKLRIYPRDPGRRDRDRFILSKGHGCLALYAALAERGFFSTRKLDTFCATDSDLGGHPEMNSVPGIEISSGSLGHGLSIGAGISLAAKCDKNRFLTYVVMGDGECDEGSVWEAAMSAAHYKLDNLVAIVDNNRQQGMGFKDTVMSGGNIVSKWKAFGWETAVVDGHSIAELVRTFDRLPFKKNKPSVIIANTTKGKGIRLMENNPIWHFRCPDEKEALEAWNDLR